jgi:hypothetical protein
MAGNWRIFLCSTAILLASANAARAYNDGLGVWCVPPTAISYYVVPTYTYYWAVPYCNPPSRGVTVVPLEGSRGIYADPIPAPPSPTREPPLFKSMPPAKAQNSSEKPPTVIATRSQGVVSAHGTTPLQKDRCRVGFHNQAGRDVTLNVEGKSFLLAKDRSRTVELNLDLGRSFSWQVDDRPPLRVERVAEGQTVLDLVISE